MISRKSQLALARRAVQCLDRRLAYAARSLRTLPLAFQSYGETDPDRKTTQPPIIMLHGLFGSKQNNRSIARALARDLRTQVLTVDLRNHGESAHDPVHTYEAMAQDILAFIEQHQLRKCTLIGHSMGAKVAMVVALRRGPEVSSLIAVDNAPISQQLQSSFEDYVDSMQAIEQANVQSQADADHILKGVEPNLAIRQFLLTNLVRREGSRVLSFRVPIDVLKAALVDMGRFPYSIEKNLLYDGPTLFIRGTQSSYISKDCEPAIRHFFPSATIVDIISGHWVISEQPDAFRRAVVSFLTERGNMN